MFDFLRCFDFELLHFVVFGLFSFSGVLSCALGFCFRFSFFQFSVFYDFSIFELSDFSMFVVFVSSIFCVS